MCPSHTIHALVSRIISGGQTGADRAALEWAMEHGIPHGGYCPQGRLAEDGTIPERYELTELPTRAYAARTKRNVLGTIIFTCKPKLTGGSKLTAELAEQQNKPWLHISATGRVDVVIAAVACFIQEHGIETLNVAGSRASKEPGVAAFVREAHRGCWPRRF